MTEAELDAIDQALSDEERRRLIDKRGGCRCFVSPPCNACCTPLTEEEAEYLGFELPAAPTQPDYMRHVRDLCR